MADERQGDFLITLASEDDKPRQGTFMDVLFALAVWLTCSRQRLGYVRRLLGRLAEARGARSCGCDRAVPHGAQFRAAQAETRGNRLCWERS